jgi:hypothetical protein
MRNTYAIAVIPKRKVAEPSVLSGRRPIVSDEGQMKFRAVQFIRAELSKAMTKMQALQLQFDQAQDELERMRNACGHCNNCSACVG